MSKRIIKEVIVLRKLNKAIAWLKSCRAETPGEEKALYELSLEAGKRSRMQSMYIRKLRRESKTKAWVREQAGL